MILKIHRKVFNPLWLTKNDAKLTMFFELNPNTPIIIMIVNVIILSIYIFRIFENQRFKILFLVFTKNFV